MERRLLIKFYKYLERKTLIRSDFKNRDDTMNETVNEFIKYIKGKKIKHES